MTVRPLRAAVIRELGDQSPPTTAARRALLVEFIEHELLDAMASLPPGDVLQRDPEHASACALRVFATLQSLKPFLIK